MRFLRARLPKTPNNLERGVGLARAGRHNEQNTVVPFGDGLDRGVDRVHLIIARRFATSVVEIILKHDPLGFRRQTLPGAVARP